jgi:predicted transcriptional regulator of viral defense system
VLTYSRGPMPPPYDADELDWILFRQRQVISRAQALRWLSDKELRTRVGSGRWQSGGRGVYVTHNGPVTREQMRWIAVLAVGAGRPAVLAGTSALECHGLRGYSNDTVHVLVPAGSRDRDPPDWVTVHRTTQLPRGDVEAGHPPRTAPARSLVDAAQWAGSDQGARTLVAGTSTCSSRSGACTSRSTAATIWRYVNGGRTCGARTHCGSRAAGSCGSRPGRCGTGRTRSSRRCVPR